MVLFNDNTGICNKFVYVDDHVFVSCQLQLSHLSRFDHDWYRGLHPGPIGTIVSILIRSHHILISIVIIGLIVGKFLAAKNFATITTICGTIVTIASDRMTS